MENSFTVGWNLDLALDHSDKPAALTMREPVARTRIRSAVSVAETSTLNSCRITARSGLETGRWIALMARNDARQWTIEETASRSQLRRARPRWNTAARTSNRSPG